MGLFKLHHFEMLFFQMRVFNLKIAVASAHSIFQNVDYYKGTVFKTITLGLLWDLNFPLESLVGYSPKVEILQKVSQYSYKLVWWSYHSLVILWKFPLWVSAKLYFLFARHLHTRLRLCLWQKYGNSGCGTLRHKKSTFQNVCWHTQVKPI